MTPPEPALQAPDQQLLRAHMQAAAGAPTGVLPRLGWIAAKALETFRHPWTYLLLIGYLLIASFIWLLFFFIGGFVTLMFAEGAILSGSTELAGWCGGLFWISALLFLGLAITGYSGGLIRMLAPMVSGRPADAMAFPTGVVTLGPRLLVVFGFALLLASVPIWLLLQFFIDLINQYGWDTIASPWNRTLQWWILGQTASRLVGIGITFAAVNVLVGPWQAFVGTRRVNLFAALPLTIAKLTSQFPVSLVVLGIIALAQWGLSRWLESSWGGAMFVQLLLTPPIWMALICLVAPDYVPEAKPIRTPTRRTPLRQPATPQGAPPPPSNPVPGLLPNR